MQARAGRARREDYLARLWPRPANANHQSLSVIYCNKGFLSEPRSGDNLLATGSCRWLADYRRYAALQETSMNRLAVLFLIAATVAFSQTQPPTRGPAEGGSP